MARRGTPFRGVLFAGLMITADGPKLIEYNVRFGDPETQPLMLRLDSPTCCRRCSPPPTATSTASNSSGATTRRSAWCWPPTATRARNSPAGIIRNLDAAAAAEGASVFHAGTRRDAGDLVAKGGRVLTVCARGSDLREARDRAYRAVDLIDWPQGFCRRDIGWRALERQETPA